MRNALSAAALALAACAPGAADPVVQKEHEAQRYRASYEAEADAREACGAELAAAIARASAAEASVAALRAELEAARKPPAPPAAVSALEASLPKDAAELRAAPPGAALVLPGAVDPAKPSLAPSKEAQEAWKRVRAAVQRTGRAARLAIVVD